METRYKKHMFELTTISFHSSPRWARQYCYRQVPVVVRFNLSRKQLVGVTPCGAFPCFPTNKDSNQMVKRGSTALSTIFLAHYYCQVHPQWIEEFATILSLETSHHKPKIIDETEGANMD